MQSRPQMSSSLGNHSLPRENFSQDLSESLMRESQVFVENTGGSGAFWSTLNQHFEEHSRLPEHSAAIWSTLEHFRSTALYVFNFGVQSVMSIGHWTLSNWVPVDKAHQFFKSQYLKKRQKKERPIFYGWFYHPETKYSMKQDIMAPSPPSLC